MSLRPRVLLLAAAVLATAAPRANADRMRADADPETDAAGAERVGAALRYYRDLAEWQLRSELDVEAYHAVRRSLGVLWAIASARPADAVAAVRPGTLHRTLLTVRPLAVASLSSTYGVRRDPFRKRRLRRHSGVDLTAERGTPVFAAGPGQVVRARRSGGYGRAVYIDHGDGIQTRYAHLQQIDVEEGAFVPAGTQVGLVGSSGRATGPHLHFEMRIGGVAVEPVELFQLLGISEAQRNEAHVRDQETPRERRRHRHRSRPLRSARPAS
jgi:murein DD-endopeptidase MepM/ murein hydrolase activator NlpD